MSRTPKRTRTVAQKSAAVKITIQQITREEGAEFFHIVPDPAARKAVLLPEPKKPKPAHLRVV